MSMSRKAKFFESVMAISCYAGRMMKVLDTAEALSDEEIDQLYEITGKLIKSAERMADDQTIDRDFTDDARKMFKEMRRFYPEYEE